MSEHGQIFAYFPGPDPRGTKWLIDITKIEAIGQGINPEVATIFTATQNYQVLIEDPLGLGQEDAMAYIATQIALASEAAERAEQEAEEVADVLQSLGESDNEDDFVEVPRPESTHLASPGATEHDCDRSGCND